MNKKTATTQPKSSSELSGKTANEDIQQISDESGSDDREQVHENENDPIDTNLVNILHDIEKSFKENEDVDETFASVLKVDVSKRKKLKRKRNESDCDGKSNSKNPSKKMKTKNNVECTSFKSDFENQLKKKRKQAVCARKKIESTLKEDSSENEDLLQENEDPTHDKEIPYDMCTEEWKKKNAMAVLQRRL